MTCKSRQVNEKIARQFIAGPVKPEYDFFKKKLVIFLFVS